MQTVTISLPETVYRRLQHAAEIAGKPITEIAALSIRERQTLTGLRATADKIMLQKAYAYLLLKWRGYRVPTLTELA